MTPNVQDQGTAPERLFDAAWVAALGELAEVPRTQTANAGPYSYSYASLGDVMSYVRPILHRHGLAVSQPPEVDDDHVVVTTVFRHTAGHREAHPPLRLPAGHTAQAIGSAITYARRYDLMSILGLATEDDDGKSAGTAPPRLIHPTTLDQFRDAAADLTADQIGDVAATATGGRTRDPAQVHADEVRSLREALEQIARPTDTPPNNVMTKNLPETEWKTLLDGMSPDQRRNTATARAHAIRDTPDG